MNTIDVLDKAVRVNGHVFSFPISYDEVKEVLGEARIDIDDDEPLEFITEKGTRRLCLKSHTFNF
jgi:hypothetical protein